MMNLTCNQEVQHTAILYSFFSNSKIKNHINKVSSPIIPNKNSGYTLILLIKETELLHSFHK